MDFSVNEKLYYKLSDFCDYNHLEFNDYIEDCIIKQFNIDRYGDLNDMFQHNEEIDVVNEVKLDENKEHLIVVQESNRETIIPLEKLPIEELKEIWNCNNNATIEVKTPFTITNDEKTVEKFGEINDKIKKEVKEEENIKPQKPKKRVLKTK